MVGKHGGASINFFSIIAFQRQNSWPWVALISIDILATSDSRLQNGQSSITENVLISKVKSVLTPDFVITAVNKST